MKLADCRVGIIGLGLMGASLAEALRGSCRSVTGMDRDEATREGAAQLGLVEEVWPAAEPLVADSDLTVLAIPVQASLELIRDFGSELPAPKRLLDLGSTKVEVVRAMAALPPASDPVGGHPMCGKERAGLAARDPSLFEGSYFVVTPLERTGEGTLALVAELIAAIGSVEIRLSPEEHDRLVAVTSHLPYLAAAGLVRRASRVEKEDGRLGKLMATGFRDSTRLAASELAMMVDILLTNRENVLAQLRALRGDLAALERGLGEGAQSLRAELAPLAAKRRDWVTLEDAEERDRGSADLWTSA